MWKRLKRFSALESDARRLFVRASVLLPVISLSLWIRGLRFTQTALERDASRKESSTTGALDSGSVSAANRRRREITVRMVKAAARYSPIRATCLEQSLALWWLLRRQGIAADLRLGARKVVGQFEAHAWIECDGEAANEVEDVHRHYAAFDRALSSVVEAR